jgi:hypothetical protein
MTEDSPKTVRLYVHLLERGTIPTRDDSLEMGASASTDSSAAQMNPEDEYSQDEGEVSARIGRSANIEYTALCKLYIFCDKVLDRTSRNLVVQAIYDATKEKRKDGA